MPGPLHGSDPPTNYWTAQGPADYQHAVYQTTTPDSTSQLEMFNLDGDVGTNSDLMNIGIPSRWPTSDATYYASTFLGNDVTSEISLSTQPVPNPELSLPVHSTSYWQTTDNGAQHVDGDMTVTTTTASGAQALRQLVVTNSSKDPVMSLNQGNIVSTSRETSEPSVSRDAGDFIVIIEDSVTSSKSRYHHVKSRKSRYSWKYILQHGSTPFLRSLGGQIKEALRYRSEADLSVIGTSVTTELINTARSVEQNPPSPGLACPFDTTCEFTFNALNTKELKEHSRVFNHDVSGARVCQWHSPGTEKRCNKPLKDFAALLKHVGQVHMKSTACTCRRCGRMLSRSDALIRHARKCM